MNLLKPFVATAITLAIISYMIPTVSFMHWTTILIAAVIVTLLDKLVRPFLKMLFLPVNIVTLGLFSMVIHVGLLWLATYLVPGFHIDNMSLLGYDLNQFFSLLVISIVLGFFQGVIGWVL